jgi:hypothetical protein
MTFARADAARTQRRGLDQFRSHRTAGFVDGIDWRLAGNLDMLNIAMREWIGQLAYAVTGR